MISTHVASVGCRAPSAALRPTHAAKATQRPALHVCRSQQGCCGSQAAAPSAAAASSGGCGCSGGGGGSQAQNSESTAAQGVIQAFGQMLGGPEGRVSREDLTAAFHTPLGEHQAEVPVGERFLDVRDWLEGAPNDLVFSDEEPEDLLVA